MEEKLQISKDMENRIIDYISKSEDIKRILEEHLRKDNGCEASADAANVCRIISRNIKLQRESLGMTQKQLSIKCGCSENFISQVERNEKIPGTLVLVSISKVLGVTLSFLAEDDGSSSDPVILPDITKRLSLLGKSEQKRVLGVIKAMYD